MKRRSFLRSIVGSMTAVIVAPAAALAELDELRRAGRTYFDMGRHQAFEPHYVEWYALKNEGPGDLILHVDTRGHFSGFRITSVQIGNNPQIEGKWR